MLTTILQFSLHHRVLVVLLTIGIAVIGVAALQRLPIDAVPDITNNQVQINTEFPALSPEEIEQQVTFRIESSLAGIPGLAYTRSISRNGFSQVTAVFDDHVDIYFARQQVTERLTDARESLPDGAEPSMGPISTGLGEVYMYVVEYENPEEKLDNAVEDKLEATPKEQSGVPFQGASQELHPRKGVLLHGVERSSVTVSTDGKLGWQSDGTYLTDKGEYLSTDFEKAGYLRTVQDWMIAPNLRTVDSVAGVDSIGGFVKQYIVEPDSKKLLAYGLTFQDLLTALEANNRAIGANYIENRGEAFIVRSDGRIKNIGEIAAIVIGSHQGTPISIRDVATVGIGRELRTGAASDNGREVVVGTALMLIGANSRTVAAAVHQRIQEIQRSLPPDVTVRTVLNRSSLVDATIVTVRNNLAEGALLVIVILFLFLGNFRAALITALVIPLSMSIAALGMVRFGISGNLMSLGAIDFGIIIDGAVIIVENCMRMLAAQQHKVGRRLNLEERLRTVFAAAKEMIGPSVFGQAIIVTVYLPILSLTGVEGKMFHPMAMTVIFALAGAFVLSLTFVPAAVALCVTGTITETENILVRAAKAVYGPILRTAVRFRWLTVGAGILIFLYSMFLFQRLGQVFVPQLDEGNIALHSLRMPSIGITESAKLQLLVEKAVSQFPEVDVVFSKTGTAEVATDPMPPNVSDGFVILKPREQWPNPSETKEELRQRIENAIREVPGQEYEFTQPIEMRFNELIAGVRGDLVVKVYGDDLGQLQATAAKIAGALRDIDGAVDIKVEQLSGLPFLNVDIDRSIASTYGLNVADVQDVVSIAIGGRNAGELYQGDRRFEILVRLNERLRDDFEALKEIPVPLRAEEGAHPLEPLTTPTNLLDNGPPMAIPLGLVADLNPSEGPNQISRENGKRRTYVAANVRGRDLGSFVEEVKTKVTDSVTMPPGYFLEYGGQYENLARARARLAIVIPVAFFLIFVLLFSNFNSVRYSLLVFTAVPLALSGGVFALWLRGMPFSISASVGFIAVSGVAVLNGLVMITYMNQLRKDGRGVDDAIRDGAMTRLRPVMMTALVASLGFLPMALSTGRGAEVQQPLATVVIGGLVTSTLLTLIVLPALYRLWHRRDDAPSGGEDDLIANVSP